MLRCALIALVCAALECDSSSCSEEEFEIPSGSSMLQVQHMKTDTSTVARSEQRSTLQQQQRDHDIECNAVPQRISPDSDFHFGSLHDVVGQDGVLVISLLRKQNRFEHSLGKLKDADIWPTEFPAADAECVSEEELRQGCIHEGSGDGEDACQGRTGTGCTSTNEQAVAESHRRALAAAMEREREWTAILEDDVVPVRPEIWNAAFHEAWKQVPDHVKLVRLSWCHFPNEVAWANLSHDSYGEVGDFLLSDWTGYSWDTGRHYNPGLCTSAYMVHRDIIPEMLQLFPCCSAVDSCYLYDFFVKGWDTGTPRGVEVMMHLDAQGSMDFAKGFQMTDMAQGGVLVQDTREIPSERDPLAN